jgi:hypothetical protein
MPHFGSTACKQAPIRTQKLSLGFGDSAFHLGWAELIMAWLLVPCEAQLQTIVAAEAIAAGQTAHARISRTWHTTRGPRWEAAGGVMSRKLEGRFLFHNFRRKPGGVPRRLILQP